jgi:hypothetical protein
MAFGGWAEARLMEPALQSPLRGQRRGGVLLLQDDADEAGPPRRVVLAQGQRLVVEVLGGRAARARLVVVPGSEFRVGVLLPAVQQLADRAGAQAEGLGDGRGGFAAAVALQDGLSERERSRCWHAKSSRWEKKPGSPSQPSSCAWGGKTRCRI